MSEYKIKFSKTYASENNARNAAINRLGPVLSKEIQWIIVPADDGIDIRYGILLIGERAVQEGLHFEFNVIG